MAAYLEALKDFTKANVNVSAIVSTGRECINHVDASAIINTGKNWAEAHPYLTAAALNLGLTPFFSFGWLASPMVWVTRPLLRMIGFGPFGPIAGQ